MKIKLTYTEPMKMNLTTGNDYVVMFSLVGARGIDGVGGEIGDHESNYNHDDIALNSTHRGAISNPHGVTASQLSDFGTAVSNNTDVALNTTHRTSDGSDHGFIDQDVTVTSSPSFNALQTNAGIANPAHSEGKVFYDAEKNALSYYNDAADITVTLGQELLIPVFNNSGSDIANGKILYPTGVDAGTGKVTVDIANAQEKDKCRLVAMATHDIANGESGYVTRLGAVGGLDTIGYSGVVYLETDGSGDWTMDKPTDGGYTTAIGTIGKVHATEGTIILDPTISELTVEVTDTNGFPPEQRENTTLDFVAVTRTFTIIPGGSDFHYYILGDKYEVIGNDDIVISDVTGEHVIYYDGSTLSELANPSELVLRDILIAKAIVAAVYWNSETGTYVVNNDKRHGISMSPDTHAAWHFALGAHYISGLAVSDVIIGDGSLDSHAQFSTTSGAISGADLLVNLAASVSTVGLKFIYRSGVNGSWLAGTNTGFSFPVGATPLPQYNEYTGSTYQLTEVGTGKFMFLHLIGTSDETEQPICMLGTEEYLNVTAASAAAETEISTLIASLPFAGYVPLASVLIEGKTTLTNSVNARVAQNIDGEDFFNWRGTTLISGAPVSSHSDLTNLELADTGVTYGHVDDQAQSIDGVKTFTDLPQSTATPSADADLVTKAYGDANYGGGGTSVSSVFTRIGAVVAVSGDYEASEVTNAFDKTVDDTDDVVEGTAKFTTAGDISKLAGIETGAEVNNISDVNATDLTDGADSTLHYHATDRSRANHSGTQAASTISNFDAEVANNTAVTLNTAKVTNVVHPLVETAVPVGALFTDTVYDDTAIQTEVDLNTVKVSNIAHPLVETAVPVGAVFTDTIYDDSDVLKDADIGVEVQAYDVNIVSDVSYVHTDNNYTTTEKTKLGTIEDSATADQTNTEIVSAIDTELGNTDWKTQSNSVTKTLTVAGANFAIGDVGYIDASGTITKTNASAEATAKGELFMATEAVNIAASGLFMRFGEVTVGTHGFTVGGAVYLDTSAGVLTDDASGHTTGQIIRIVGTSMSSTVIFFSPDQVFLEV